MSAAAVAEAEKHAIVRPNGRSLAIAQHRLKEKTFLAELGLPVAPFAPMRTDARPRRGGGTPLARPRC